MKQTAALLWLLLPWLLMACVPTSTQPVAKIGLIAPFEGIYRRTGYEALAAMRLAIAEADKVVDAADGRALDVLPLALDDSNRAAAARRAAQKLLVDPAVVAVVGPVTPQSARGAAPVLHDSRVAWLPPFAVPSQLAATPVTAPSAQEEANKGQIPAADNVFDRETPMPAHPDSDRWAMDLLLAVAEAARAQGAQRLVLAGDGAGWPLADMTDSHSLRAHGVIALASPEQVEATDAVLWLGESAAGAAYLAQLRQTHAGVPFWLGPTGGDPVFAEHVAARGLRLSDGIYWATWLDAGYADWQQQTGLSPSAYLVYRATQQAIAVAVRTHAAPASTADGEWLVRQLPMEEASKAASDWRIYLFEFLSDGTSSPFPLSHP